jgi:hypothetical protein
MRRRRPHLSLAACCFVLALSYLGACGRKTDVKPPELVAPEIVTEVTVRNLDEGIRVRWQRPRHYADGSQMRDLAGFYLERSRGSAAFSRIATIPVVDRDRFRQARRFDHVDADVQMGERYRYRVFGFTEAGDIGESSEIVEIERAAPAIEDEEKQPDHPEPGNRD